MPAKWAAVLSITILLASSCTDPSEIGLELDPENNQLGVFYTEIPLSASMVLLDSFNTTNANVLMAGGDISPFFGTTEAIGFSRVNFVPYNRDIPAAARPNATSVLDSARFQFTITNQMTANSFAENKTLSVHRLLEPIQDITYYNSDKLAYDENPIAVGSYRLNAGRDTIVSAPLNETIANDFFNRLKSNDPIFRDLFAFREYFPGIAIKGRVEEQAGLPVNVMNTGMVLYYRNEGDTVSRRFLISTAESRSFNHINNNRTGTPLEIVQEPRTAYDVGNLVGLKANTGLVMKINTAPLQSFMDTLQNVVFNQVILEMGPVEALSEGFMPFDFLYMFYSINNTGMFSNPDYRRVERDPRQGQVNPEPARLSYLEDTRLYRQSITSYTNNLYRSGQENYNLIIHPDDPDLPVEVNLNISSVQTVDTRRLTSQQRPNLDYKESLRQLIVDQNTIKLKLYYSKIK
ncbi:hypothetical protein EL17_19485 [Anditalea andensis]|uniref:DUF4270 domain-containing protein n=1 Tax=Anditalea andensis TaxID=1048983 RepID=A0A074KV50_9BACT|nr:hypothetical protein EL17_19485 [Anditalea andensis]